MKSTSNSKQAAWIAIGQFFAYAIGIVSPMILSRYLTKADYGTYKQIMYVYGTLLTVFSFGLPRAYSYFIPKVTLEESKDVIRKISKIFILIGCFFSMLLFFGAHAISQILVNEDLERALKLFSPTPLFLLPVMGLDCILASYKRTMLVAIYTVVTKVLTLLCIVMPVIFFEGNCIHAIIGFDIASILTFIVAKYLQNLPTKNISLVKTSITYKDIYNFTAPLILASVWIAVFQSSNQFFVSRYYGNEIFAEFSNGFMEFPIIPMVLSSVATILLPLFSGMTIKEKDHIIIVWMNALTKSVKITYPMLIFCMVFSDLVMTCFYGSQYSNSSQYFFVKSIEGLFLVIPFYPIILALGKGKEYSNVHFIIAILILILDYLVVKLELPALAIGIVFVLCSFLKIIMQFSIISKSMQVSTIDFIPVKSMLKIASISLAATLLPYFVYHCIPDKANPFIVLIVLCMSFVLCYYILCWIFKVSYKGIIQSYLSDKKFRGIIKYIP